MSDSLELVRGLHNVRPRHRVCAATIGNLDGVHRGHQAVLGQLGARAAELHLPTVVITFEPQPQEYFSSSSAPSRLTRFREKMLALQEFSVDRVLCLSFDKKIAERSPEQFVTDILVNGLGVKYLVVGDDFRFGKGRHGDFSYLQNSGKENGFQVASTNTIEVDGERVSSTRIRGKLADGDIAGAQKLLGRPYRMSGRVVQGDQRGRTIGFPTANILLHRNKTPVNGVFAVQMSGLEGTSVNGVANVGTRPTVDGTRALLEVFLFDFDQDIYGRYVQVDFLHKLRDEVRFDSIDELTIQIGKDVQDAQDYFEQLPIS